VSAHCHPISATKRCVEFGVRVIEHGTLMDDETARLISERGAYVVPTLAVIQALQEHGSQLGLSPHSQQKIHTIFNEALQGLESMRRAGVKIGFGTDLLGETYVQQCREFSLRKEIFRPVEILRQATSLNAEIIQRAGTLGCIAPGALADLLVVEGDPLKDIEVLASNGRNLRVIVKDGEIVRNELS